ncbi:LysE/ArgO family amino acid transporter [Microbacteriaceae bacterium 4G12]
MKAILHGLILSFGLILPLGVQNVFVFSQGATQPKLLRALPAAITAALCDTFLIILAVFGLSVIVLQFHWLRLSLMIVGILFLLYMGYVIWKSEPTTNKTNTALPIRQQIVFALSVSLFNPHAILDIVGVIGTSSFYNHMYRSFLDLVLWVNACWYSYEEVRWYRKFNEHI